MGKGRQPSVAEVADHSGISRATAYRYFSTSDEIIQEAVLDGVAGHIKVPPGSADDSVEAVGGRLDRLVAEVHDMVSANETMFRAFLASSAVGNQEMRRTGRRIGWLNEMFSPLEDRIAAEDRKFLVQALSVLTGIEAVVVLRDICGLDPEETSQTLRRMAQILFTQVAELPPTSTRSKNGARKQKSATA